MPTSAILKVKLLSTDAKVPTRESTTAAGLDVYSPISVSLQPGSYETIPLDIAVECPPHSYVRVAPRSGLAVKYGLDTLAGVIDSDYRGNIAVVLINHGKTTAHVHAGQRIAQLIMEKIDSPEIRIVNELSSTSRNSQGFGSTDKKKSFSPSPPKFPSSAFPEPTIIAARAAKASSMMTSNSIMSDEIELSNDPYDNQVDITIPYRKCAHPTLGLELELCPYRNLPCLKNCAKGTPAARITRWRSVLRNGYVLSINGTPVSTVEDICTSITKTQDLHKDVVVVFGIIEKASLHPQNGTPLVYFDQLQHIGMHLHEMKQNAWWSKEESADATRDYVNQFNMSDDVGTTHTLSPILPKNKMTQHKLTRRKLQLLPPDEWQQWQQSEYLQLDQYEKQQTFGPPQARPLGSNCLPLLWTYLIKEDGRKKARCVCNGSPSKKGSVTLGHTYAASLDQNGSRIFWATAALRNLRVYGADVSNAFAEAPPPAAPLFVHVDKQFRDWWTSKGRPPIPKGYVLPVLGALQGHPESPRLWATLINGILVNDFNLRPTTHEPCLYSGQFNGENILFLRQTDDFAVACTDEKVATDLIDSINRKMSVEIKYLGLITRFNGVDVEQTDKYIKIHNTTFVNKILDFHHWQISTLNPVDNVNPTTPMTSDPSFLRSLENSQPPLLKDESIALQRKMGFNYRQAIGELLYAMVTCRPDISFPVIKLSQYSNAPCEVHYNAVRDIFQYLARTKDKGITYWKPTIDPDLPNGTIPHLHPSPHATDEPIPHPDQNILQGSVDSDWAGDSSHRRSITAYSLELAGASIFYKTKFQETIATSSSEAEFTAACEAAKSICYVRSILDEIGVPQDFATALYIDNQGALLMADAKQPTKRTRHMDIKHFKIQEWVERDIVSMRRIATKANVSDALTKPLSVDVFHRHMDRIMGNCIPPYSKHFRQQYSGQLGPHVSCSSEHGGGVT